MRIRGDCKRETTKSGGEERREGRTEREGE